MVAIALAIGLSSCTTGGSQTPPPTTQTTYPSPTVTTTPPVTTASSATPTTSTGRSTTRSSAITCRVFNTLPKSEQVRAIQNMMKSHGLTTSSNDVGITYGSTRAFCNVSPPNSTIDGIYGG